MNIGGKEIERKFLIGYPSPDVLAECVKTIGITQTYLTRSENGGRARVRKSVCGNDVSYTHTEKIRVTDITRIENERIISEGEYFQLLKDADPGRNPISKTRYHLVYKDQLFEIDVFPFWNDRAFMEIELNDEADEIQLPPEIDIIREVTDDKRYTNSALAVSIPDEKL